MPKVPTLESSVAESRLPSVSVSTQAPAGAFGGGQIKEFQQLAKTTTGIIDVASEHQKQANKIRVTEANAELEKFTDDLLYGQGEGQGLMLHQGKNAFDINNLFKENHDKKVEEISKSLGNDAQREAFRLASLESGIANGKTVERKMGAEIQKHATAVTEAGLNNKVKYALRNYHDPAQIEVADKKAMALVDDLAGIKGMDKEQVKAKKGEVQDQIYGGVIKRYIDAGEASNGKALFAKYKDKMSPSVQSEIEKALKRVGIKQQSQEQADALMAKGKELQDTLEDARKIKDPEVRDATVQRVKTRFTEKEAISRMESESNHKKAFDIVNENPNMDLIDDSILSKLKPAQITSLNNFVKSKVAGIPIKTDLKTYYNLQSMASVPALQTKFLKINLMNYVDKLSESDFKSMVALQTGLRKNDANAHAQVDGFQSDKQVVDDALSGQNIDKDSKRAVDFRAAVDRQVRLWKIDHPGKTKIDNDSLRGITDALLLEGEVTNKGWLHDPDKRLFEVKPGETFEVDFDSIPAAEVDKIKKAYQARGVENPSEEQISQRYIIRVNKRLKRGN